MFDDVTTISDSGTRRLLAAILLRACADASNGDRGAMRFLKSTYSAAIAQTLEVRQWPPTLDMLCGMGELKSRKKSLNADERETGVKRAGRESVALDFSSRSTHTSGNRTKAGRSSVGST